MKKILFVVLDGLGDTMLEGKQTTLQSAFKPYLDSITRNGFAGLIENRLKEHPDSGLSTFVLFGYDRNDYPGRGFLDALGIGMRAMPDTIYIRANFATVEEIDGKGEFVVKDRRAGRDKSGLLELSDAIREIVIDGVRVEFHKSVGHRGVVLISNAQISSKVSDSDSEFVGEKVNTIKPLSEDNLSIRTASILNKWQHEVYRILKSHRANKYRKIPANFILLRGTSSYSIGKTFKENFGLNAGVVAASPVVKGIARYLEMDAIDVSGATADMNTNLIEKTLSALDMLRKKDLVVLHILGCDIAGHEKSISSKRAFLEKIDREVFKRIMEYVDFKNIILVVTSDHITSVFTGMHEAGSFPFAIFSRGINPNEVQKFDEQSCKLGPEIDIDDFMEEVLKFI